MKLVTSQHPGWSGGSSVPKVIVRHKLLQNADSPIFSNKKKGGKNDWIFRRPSWKGLPYSYHLFGNQGALLAPHMGHLNFSLKNAPSRPLAVGRNHVVKLAIFPVNKQKRMTDGLTPCVTWWWVVGFFDKLWDGNQTNKNGPAQVDWETSLKNFDLKKK